MRPKAVLMAVCCNPSGCLRHRTKNFPHFKRNRDMKIFCAGFLGENKARKKAVKERTHQCETERLTTRNTVIAQKDKQSFAQDF